MKIENFGSSNKLKTLYYLLFVVTVASLLLSGGAFADTPNIDDTGIYYNSIEIAKADMPHLESDVFQIIYSGDYQEFLDLQNVYATAGTVYYRVGEDGDWSDEVPKLKFVGEYDIYYYVVANSNYNDLASVLNPMKVTVNIVDWGNKVENYGVTNYVDSSGKTSAEVDKNDIIWLKEESDGSSAWYGLDNSRGTFRKGLRFWVRWLSKDSDAEEFARYYNQLDDTHKNIADNNKTWIFLIGVVDQDGNEYTDFDGNIDFYIELGDDWDKNDINAVFISPREDEVLDVSYIDNFNHPQGSKTFAKLVLDHFSPYLIYERAENSGSSEREEPETVNSGGISDTGNTGNKEKVKNEEPKIVDNSEVSKTSKSPKTGDLNLKFYIVAIVFSISAIIYISLKMKRKTK